MATRSPTHLFHRLDHGNYVMKRQETFRQFITSIFTRFHAQSSKSEKEGVDESRRRQEASPTSKEAKQNEQKNESSGISVYGSDDDDFSDKKWRLEFAWLTKALDPALQMCRRALVTVDDDNQKIPPSNRSLLEIVASLQRSKTNIQDWSLSDFTTGLYLVYLRQASEEKNEDIDGVQISSEHIVNDLSSCGVFPPHIKVEELIYHSELAKGSYKGNAAALARNSMLQEMNVLKYIKDSSILRPGYYIGTDIRNKSIILGIRGTHTVYDIITDMVASSDEEITFDGFSTHFGTAEAARWFLHHELGTIKKCLEQHPGFRLRLVGHSLGGAAAALLAIMLRRRSEKELGFSPDIVSAVGFGTPPCVSKELAETCASYVCTVVLQDDIVPRLSAASLARLRNEILQTDWISVLDKEDWKRFLELVTNAKQVVSSVQDVARKLADYAKFKNKKNATELSEEVSAVTKDSSKPQTDSTIVKRDAAMLEELFVPGAQYYLQRKVDASGSSSRKGREYYTLWKRHRGKHFQRIVLSSNLISDHKCDNHYYALRDVLKSIPRSDHQKSISLYD